MLWMTRRIRPTAGSARSVFVACDRLVVQAELVRQPLAHHEKVFRGLGPSFEQGLVAPIHGLSLWEAEHVVGAGDDIIGDVAFPGGDGFEQVDRGGDRDPGSAPP